MFKLINGWTKASVLERIKARNKGYCANDRDECVYRSADGNQCYAGCFIPNERYSRFWDEPGHTKSISGLLNEDPELAQFLPFDRDGMTFLQRIHDSAADRHLTLEERYANLKNWLDVNAEDAVPSPQVGGSSDGRAPGC